MVYLSHQQLYEPMFSSGNAENVVFLLSDLELRTCERVEEEELEGSDCFSGGLSLNMPANILCLKRTFGNVRN